MKIWRKIEGFVGCKFLIVRRDGSAPHWPAFVLGARDPHAPAALLAYVDAIESGGGDAEYISSIRELAADFRRYRDAHGNGDPEAPPHRRDDPDVILAMRGWDKMIHVRPDRGNVKKETGRG